MHTIRKLTKNDVKEYWRLRLIALRDHPEAFGSSYEDYVVKSEESLINQFEGMISPVEDRMIIGAFDGDELLGSVFLARDKNYKHRHKAWILGVFICDKARGTGVSKKLMQHVIDAGRDMQGIEMLKLSVMSENMPAIKLYESFGFEAWGREEKYALIDGIYYAETHMTLEFK